MDPLTSDLAHLDLSPLDEDDDPPVYRSGAGNAFDSWAAFGDAICDADHASSKDKRPPTVGEGASAEEKFRCTLPDVWNSWDISEVQSGLLDHNEPAHRMIVSLTPHRTEGIGSEEEEWLVCSLRQ